MMKDGIKKPRGSGAETIRFVLQGILVGIACFCLLGISEWKENGLTLTGMNQSFEETDLFCETVEEIVLEKIDMQQDILLFEEDGKYNEWKEIDIRQYMSESQEAQNPNPNISYTLGDLIAFGEEESGRLMRRISALMNGQNSDMTVGHILYGESDELETIRPVSGHSLAEYAQVSSNPDTALLEYYRLLAETSEDIALRYRNYEEMKESGNNPVKAPSNVYYYVEDFGTGRRYTNLGVKSLVAARTLIRSQNQVELLFEGDRRYNIMVAAEDYSANDNAALYFMQSRFTGNSESVLIAYDTEFTVGDDLQAAAFLYRERKPALIGMTLTLGAALAVLFVLLIWSVAGTVRYNNSKALAPGPASQAPGKGFDAVPTEIAFGIILIGAISWWTAANGILEYLEWPELWERITGSLAAAVEYWIILAGLLHMIRRLCCGRFWKNSVIYSIIMGGRQVYSARRSSERLLIAYVGFVVLNMAFLLIGGVTGGIMALILNLAALLYLMRDVVGSRSVREGLDQISKGRLDYRINTQVLTGESREMGEAVNEMGEGLQRSVAAMLEHERLKSELITNVSHDLKTPLTSIINYVDLLKREPLPEEGHAREYLEVLDRKTKRLKQLTEDLIEVSRINSGNVKLDMQPLQVWMFLQQACGEFEDRFTQNNLQLILKREDGPPGTDPKNEWMIRSDGTQLWRVYENILGNAAKYAMPGTDVTLTVARQGSRILTKLKNVPAEPILVSAGELEERFTRGDASRSTEGSGLGISIAKSLTEYMNGTFELTVSENLFEVIIGFESLNA